MYRPGLRPVLGCWGNAKPGWHQAGDGAFGVLEWWAWGDKQRRRNGAQWSDSSV